MPPITKLKEALRALEGLKKAFNRLPKFKKEIQLSTEDIIVGPPPVGSTIEEELFDPGLWESGRPRLAIVRRNYSPTDYDAPGEIKYIYRSSLSPTIWDLAEDHFQNNLLGVPDTQAYILEDPVRITRLLGRNPRAISNYITYLKNLKALLKDIDSAVEAPFLENPDFPKYEYKVEELDPRTRRALESRDRIERFKTAKRIK